MRLRRLLAWRPLSSTGELIPGSGIALPRIIGTIAASFLIAFKERSNLDTWLRRVSSDTYRAPRCFSFSKQTACHRSGMVSYMIVVSLIDSQQVTDAGTIPSLLRVQLRPHYFLTAA